MHKNKPGLLSICLSVGWVACLSVCQSDAPPIILLVQAQAKTNTLLWLWVLAWRRWKAEVCAPVKGYTPAEDGDQGERETRQRHFSLVFHTRFSNWPVSHFRLWKDQLPQSEMCVKPIFSLKKSWDLFRNCYDAKYVLGNEITLMVSGAVFLGQSF